jgi:5-methylcytosine-specific restriction endonuclease McrA
LNLVREQELLRCGKCGQDLPPGAFYKNRSGRKGRSWRCKPCHNGESYPSRKAWGLQHKGHISEYNRQYRKLNADWIREQQQEYLERNREKQRNWQHAYRARRTEAGGYLDLRDFFELCEFLGWKCTYCEITLTPGTVTVDHIVPVSRGGRHELENVTPACKSCNCRKHNKLPEEVDWRSS